MNINYDRTLDIATASNRRVKTWRNVQIKWSDLLDRLSTPTRTSETVAEYKRLSKDRQSEIKDTGGFVGGYLDDGKRANVRHRSVVCLDADYADDNLWPDWLMLRGNASAVYSTHKHTKENPRLRLVIPLSRDVSAEEYQAVARWLAYEIGIDKFDDTTYQPQRVMYYPSCSYDGEYVFDHCDGEILDPDTVLANYKNWKDVSSWPFSSRTTEAVKKVVGAKQEDPLTKKGLVGAFCRAYTIHEAIDQFVPVYTPCGSDRYTYTEGSTAGGVVVYDDKFCFSNHATDPASGQLCNAWDIVRIHQFGELDSNVGEDMPMTKRPSFKAMSEFTANDERAKIQLLHDRKEEAFTDYEPLPDETVPEDTTEWQTKLVFTEKGIIAQTIQNSVIILRYDPALRGAIGYNEFDHTIVARKSLPWREVRGDEPWDDSDDAALRLYMESQYGITGKDRIYDAVNVVAVEHSFHPVREYLSGLSWDGLPRVESLLIDYLGAADTPYTRAVTRKALVGAVARIYNPGVKFDYVLMLKGEQGVGKSTIIGKLAGKWYSDSLTTMQGKDSYEQVHGVWIMELAELAGMKKSEVEVVKQFISKQVDRFRPAYGRRTQEFPRQCTFWGTTNEAAFLRDTTGNRRFWVVDTPDAKNCQMKPADIPKDTVDQIWAEAVVMYKRGERLYLTAEMEQIAREIQSEFAEESPRFGLVADYLDRKLPSGWWDMNLPDRRTWLEENAPEAGEIERVAVSNIEIWAECFGKSPEGFDIYGQREIMSIMSAMPGWRKATTGSQLRRVKPYGRQRYYERVTDGT